MPPHFSTKYTPVLNVTAKKTTWFTTEFKLY